MVKEAALQVRMDSELKNQFEFYRQMEILSGPEGKRILGIANGQYEIPSDIDGSNDEILKMFGVK